jgi:hypothetical protein
LLCSNLGRLNPYLERQAARWPREKEQIKDELHAGSIRFSLLSKITLKDGARTQDRSS